MNMKKNIFTALIISTTAFILVSCGGQDEIYKEWIKEGGYDYPAKAINMTYLQGYQKITLMWEKPMDPAVKRAILYWDNYAKSRDIDYGDFADGKVTIVVDSLEDRSYTFDVVNFDGEDNKSLPAEMTIFPYGDSWLISRSERAVVSAIMDGDDAKIEMTKATDEMVATRFRYKDATGAWVNCETILKPGTNEITLPGALKGKRFEYSSAFCPSYGRDTVWRPWTISNDGISYKINASRWNVTVTTNQVFSENTPDKIIDGKVSSAYRWHSSRTEGTSNIFPKILSIDTGTSPGAEFAFTKFVFYEHPNTVSMRYIKNYVMFIGSSPYDPNADDYATAFGIPFLSGIMSTANPTSEVAASTGAAGRYIAIVFPNSWSSDGYIDLWELEPYGYIPSEAD